MVSWLSDVSCGAGNRLLMVKLSRWHAPLPLSLARPGTYSFRVFQTDAELDVLSRPPRKSDTKMAPRGSPDTTPTTVVASSRSTRKEHVLSSAYTARPRRLYASQTDILSLEPAAKKPALRLSSNVSPNWTNLE
eukprot:219422_1